MLPKSSTNPVKGDGVGARVQIGQAEADDAQVVPKGVEQVLGVGVEVEEEHEHVRREKAHGEHQHEDEDGDGDLLPGTDLGKKGKINERKNSVGGDSR